MTTGMNCVVGSGSGTLSVKQVIMQTITGTSFVNITTPITVDGLAVVMVTNNYNNMQWKNVTKGTSGNFTDIVSYTCGYASFEVSAGDTIQINVNSGASRYVVMQIVGID